MLLHEEKEDKKINSLDWSKLNVSELYIQKNILSERYLIAQQLDNQPLLRQLKFGMNELDSIIKQKINEEGSPNNKNILT